jgi:predicted small lipoprotein YifL
MRWLSLPLLLALAACGQKGNLYLPDDNVETVPVSTGPAAAPGAAAPAATAPDAASPEQDPGDDKPAPRN